MSVVDRLKRLTGEEAQKPDEKQVAIQDLRRRIEGIMARREPLSPRPVSPARTSPRELADILGGEEVRNALGAFLFIRRRHPGGSPHGQSLIRDCLRIDMPSAALISSQPQIAHLAPHDALFLDTETTGLSGGTGTFPFLVGLGWFEGSDFITCQLLARDYHEERAMLAFLQETAAEKRFLVTFNGKAFDVNLLGTRYVLGRLSDPLSGMPHLDLLNPSRRLLSHRTSNCRLVTLEAEVLGLMRDGDIPGWEIPQRYFDWLRTGNAHLFVDILEHNRLDIVSMAALARHLTSILAGLDPQAHHKGDVFAAARLHHERGNLAQAQGLLETIVGQDADQDAREALKLLSLIHKRSGRWNQAVPIWEGFLKEMPGDIFAAEELAKWCEHRTRDFGRAIVLVEQALAYAKDPEREGLEHRLARLLTKRGQIE